MSDVYNFITSDDPRTGALTAAQLESRRRIAVALATRNRPYPKTIGEGLTALGEGLGEGMNLGRLDRAEAAQAARDAEGAARLRGGAVPTAAPGGASLDSDPTQAYAMAPPDTAAEAQPSTVEQAPQKQSMSLDEWKQRTARDLTGGEKDPYRAISPPNNRGDYGVR